jgi:hypothetical protein
MSSLFDKQNLGTKLKFVKNNDPEKFINLNISVALNHEIKKNLLTKIEENINAILLDDYEKYDAYKKRATNYENNQKELKQIQKQREKETKQLMKLKSIEVKQKENRKMII